MSLRTHQPSPPSSTPSRSKKQTTGSGGSHTKKSPLGDSEQVAELLALLKSSTTSSSGASSLNPANPHGSGGNTGGEGGSTHIPIAASPSPSGSHHHSHSRSVTPSSASSSASTSTSSASTSSTLPTAPSSTRSKRPKNAEESRLDSFLLRHSKSYSFNPLEVFEPLLTSLVSDRLLNTEWERQATREHRLRVLRAIRVLSRDPGLQEVFLKLRPLAALAQSLRTYTLEYFRGEAIMMGTGGAAASGGSGGGAVAPASSSGSGGGPAYCAESIIEICSILKRIASEESQDRRIFEQGSFLLSLVQLLSARDHAILQAVLVTLVNLSGSGLFVDKVMELPVIEPLLNILQDFATLATTTTTTSSSGSGSGGGTGGSTNSANGVSPASSTSSQSISSARSTATTASSSSHTTTLSASSSTSSTSSATPPSSSSSSSTPPPTYHFLAAELLDLLSEYHEVRQEIHLLSGNAIFLRLVHRAREHETILLPVLRCLANQALEPESSREIRFLGGIQLLLGIIGGEQPNQANTTARPSSHHSSSSSSSSSLTNTPSTPTPTFSSSSSSSSSPSHPPASESLLISACICLTQLAMDDENAYQIRRAQGVYALGMLFLRGATGPPPGGVAAFATSASSSSSAATPHPTPSSLDVQAHACRALRFLYSVERNRKVLKRCFPLPELFAAFVDVGHYVHQLQPYEHVVDLLNAQPSGAKQQLFVAFEALRAAGYHTLLHVGAGGPDGSGSGGNGPPGPRMVRGYILQEVLGKGAFGTVYQVQKENGDKLYAMKELSLKEMQKNTIAGGAGGSMGSASNAASSSTSSSTPSSSSDAVRHAAHELVKEVDILSQLEHPNIVRYYTSFLEGPSIYIVMELVTGSSLLDHLTSYVEKGGSMPEESIWPIFIQICLALCYMHMEKRVVHRDLTPSNIMINDRKQVKIADFGLARQTHNGTLLQSAVGTISYSCPEIVMHETYTDKADIWSLGCILYQMATGKPAFAGSNPLTVAQKIVSGSYDPLPSTYSPLLHEMVRRLLTVDPHTRPDILAVSSLISPLLMAELDRVTILMERVTQQYQHEVEARRRERDEWNREKQTYRKWMAAANQTQKWAQMQGGGGGAAAAAAAAAAGGLMPGGVMVGASPSPVHAASPHASHATLNGASSSSYLAATGDGSTPLPPPSTSSASSATSSASDLSPPASAPLFRVSSSAVRPTQHDPLTLLLSQLHKLVYVSQLPPKSTRDLKRTIVARYKHALFARRFEPAAFKQELQRIVAGSQDVIDDSFQLPHLDASTLLSTPHAPSASGSTGAAAHSHRLTHEELQLMIEQVLEEVGYYAQTPAQPFSPSQGDSYR